MKRLSFLLLMFLSLLHLYNSLPTQYAFIQLSSFFTRNFACTLESYHFGLFCISWKMQRHWIIATRPEEWDH